MRRSAECYASAAAIGAKRVEFLGYTDSGMMGEPSNDAPFCFWQADVEYAARTLAVLLDQEEPDEKILAVPNHNPRFDQIHTIDQVFSHNLREIEHFFAIYKELEGKRTVMKGWKGPREGREVIRRSRERYLEAHKELKTE